MQLPKLFLAAVLLAPLSSGHAAAQASPAYCDRSPIRISNVSLWNDGKPLRQREVLIAEGRISAIGRAGSTGSGKARTIDAGGAYLLPGFIDAHSHYVLPAPAPKLGGDQGQQELAITGRAALGSGLTTTRIHLMPLDQVRELQPVAEDPCFPAPRMEFGGPGLMGNLGPRGARLVWGFKDRATTDAKLKEMREAGVRWLALHDADKLPPGELAHVAETAGKVGLRIMAAGQTRAEIDASLSVQAASLEYGMFDPLEDYDPALIERLRRSQTAISIPIGYYQRLARYRANPGLLNHPDFYRFMTADVAATLREAQKKQIDDPSTPRRNATLAAQRFRKLADAGLNMVVSTDSGSAAQFHPTAYWIELEEWRQLGVAPGSILAGATSRPATMLGRTDIGRIAVGANADFLLYRGDLSRGEFDPGKLDTVAKGGVLYVRGGRWVGPPVEEAK